MTHGQRARSHKAFPTLAEFESLDGSPSRIGPVEHPDRLAVLRGRFKNIAQSCDEGIDTTAQVLQVNEQHVETIHHCRRGTAHLAVETKNRNPVHRVVEVRRFDHVVLFVATEPVLGTEGRNQLYVVAARERVQRVNEVACHGGGVGEERDAAPDQRFS